MEGASAYGRPGQVVFETCNVEPHELRAYEVLRLHGHSFRVLAVDPEARARGLSSLDIEMYGCLWELKCPRGARRKSITRNLNRAIAQFKKMGKPVEDIRIVLSALESDLPNEVIIHGIEKTMREGEVDDLILILSETDVRYYKRKAEIPIALLRQTGGCLRENHDTTIKRVTEAQAEQEKAEIPIALLVQMGGCLRNWDYSIAAELAGGELSVSFGCVRPVLRSCRYSAVRLGRSRRAARRQEALR